MTQTRYEMRKYRAKGSLTMTKALPDYSVEVSQLTEAYFLQVSILIPLEVCSLHFLTCAPTRRNIWLR